MYKREREKEKERKNIYKSSINVDKKKTYYIKAYTYHSSGILYIFESTLLR